MFLSLRHHDQRPLAFATEEAAGVQRFGVAANPGGTTGRRWAQWARNKGLSGGDSPRRFLTGQVEASRPSSALAARSQAGSPRLPAARAAVGGPAQRHLLPRDPAARPGAHDGADLRQTVEPLL